MRASWPVLGPAYGRTRGPGRRKSRRDPAIHDFDDLRIEDVDARDTRGHDVREKFSEQEAIQLFTWKRTE